jgi:hypothetical protein
MTLKIEAGKKYRTRGGDEVEILRTDVRQWQPIVGIITKDDGSQYATEWSADGFFCPDRVESHHDIISEIKPKRVVWLNVYPEDDCGFYYGSRAETDRQANPCRIACIRVEFEEGQFDDE